MTDLPFVPSPPLVPSLNGPQLQLVRLMQRCAYVAEWRHLFQGAMIRAKTDRGHTCTVALEDIESLLGSGVIDRSWGGGFHLTETGKAI